MPSSKKRTPRLGRGLSSLMAQPVKVELKTTTPGKTGGRQGGDGVSPASPTAAVLPAAVVLPGGPPARVTSPSGDTDGLHHLAVEAIRPNRYQPRQAIDEASLQQLAESIRVDGLMQPIVVRPAEAAGQYELIAGERRWRAARLAEVAAIPALIRQLDDQQAAEWALIENLQREDLNPIERAEAFQRLAKQFDLSHQQIGRRVGLERSTVANLLRLLELCPEARQYVRDGLLSMGQARALAGLSDVVAQKALADRAIKQGLSVRQVEAAVRDMSRAPDSSPSRGGRQSTRSAYLTDLEQQIAEQLHTRVTIRPGRKKGSGAMTIEFYSLDQFDTLLDRLGVRTQ